MLVWRYLHAAQMKTRKRRRRANVGEALDDVLRSYVSSCELSFFLRQTVAPGPSVYVPTGHGRHVVDAEAGEWVPFEQGWHTLWFSSYVPENMA